MAQLLDVFGFLSVVLRGVTLAFQSLAVGGVAFLLWALRGRDARMELGIRYAAIGLAIAQALYLTVDSALLAGTTGLSFAELTGANYFLAGSATIVGSLLLAVIPIGLSMWIPVALVLGGTLATSHAMARMEHRLVLGTLTLLHQAATAVWIGGLPFLVLSLRTSGDAVWKRFSAISIVSVSVLAAAGFALSYFYVGSVHAIYGSAYGVMVAAKVLLFGFLLLLGAANYFAVKQGGLLSRMRAVGEAEIGFGFCVVFAAASLTSQPPAIDIPANLVPGAVVAERMTPREPRFTTPTLSSQHMLPEERDHNDSEWSEYNHHWAGLVVLSMGVLAVLHRTGHVRWARNWPLLFVALGIFLLLRSDADVWPLGPKGFFASLNNTEILQHRLAVLLIFAFAAFEWGVETGRLTSQRAALVFPAVCALGGGLLLTHSHSLTNVREELLAEMSHVPLAIFGIAAGWARWLELRLPVKDRRIPGAIWPLSFSMVGVVLLLYREL